MGHAVDVPCRPSIMRGAYADASWKYQTYATVFQMVFAVRMWAIVDGEEEFDAINAVGTFVPESFGAHNAVAFGMNFFKPRIDFVF